MRLPKSIKKVIRFLPTIGRQDVMTFSVFVVVSFIFWMVQSGYEKSDSTYYVKLHIENMPTGAVFTTHIPASLKVTLYDNNVHLVNYGGKKGFNSLTVDFNRYADVAGNFRISGAELTSLLMNELSSSTQITAISPALIDARYALTDGKKVPVHLNGSFYTRGNYKNFAPQLYPDSVLVHAPNSILDTLTRIESNTILYSDLKDTLRCKIGLNLGLGVKATPDSIQLVVPVMQYVNKTFQQIPIQVTGLPANKRLILFPRQVSLQCLANFSHYNQYTAEQFKVTVAYDSLLANPNRKFLPLSVQTTLDEYEVYNLKLSQSEVEFSLESFSPQSNSDLKQSY